MSPKPHLHYRPFPFLIYPNTFDRHPIKKKMQITKLVNEQLIYISLKLILFYIKMLWYFKNNRQNI